MQSPAAPDLGIDVVTRVDGTVLIRLSGELDLSTAPRIQARVVEAADRGEGSRDMRLDVQGLRFCDASGLAVFASAADRLRRRGGRLHLENASPQLRRVISLAELSHLLD